MSQSILTAAKARSQLKRFARPDRAKLMLGFFKTGKGEYGEGDRFIGVTVPETRSVARKAILMPLDEVRVLLHSPIHEERLLALTILTEKFKRTDPKSRKAIFDLYIKNLKWVNNWDLVDASAAYIAGPIFYDQKYSSALGRKKTRSELLKMASSKNLWVRRVGVLTTFYFIRQNDFDEILVLAKHLLKDEHDLIHKAVGWLLRETGKRDVKVLRKFLNTHSKAMPRTMLRYSIEKLSPALRAQYMAR